ncbi:MAG TPA: acetoacetate decarboxylase family protein [Thermoanaerobaculia bacterium]
MTAPSISRVPPPWRLRGSGYVFLFTLEPWFLRNGGFLPPELTGEHFVGQLGALMLVEYRKSPVGPYRELLFAAGRNLRWRHHLFSVTRIWVSTEASAVSGRENWAIPKETAEFEVIKERDSERVIVQRDHHAEVDLTVAPGRGLPVPALGFLAPPSWRTIVQFRDGQILETRLSGRGVLRPAKLLDFRTLPQAFPDVNQGKLVGGFFIKDFRLWFPGARMTQG